MWIALACLGALALTFLDTQPPLWDLVTGSYGRRHTRERASADARHLAELIAHTKRPEAGQYDDDLIDAGILVGDRDATRAYWWGNRMLIRRTPDGVHVVSLGADGVGATEDDVEASAPWR